jgi:3-dehydroquinate synthase
MRSFHIQTRPRPYLAIIERGILGRISRYIPKDTGKIFILTTRDVWELHGAKLEEGLTARAAEILFFPGGEERKRLASLEILAEQMVRRGGDRTSLVVAFGGGIVNDLGGFLASVFMRGVPVLQVPTTLLAQVDAAIGGKTGVNLTTGKNLLGTFHQPVAVLIDPDVLSTLAEREYRAGVYEVLKCGIIRSLNLFSLMSAKHEQVLARAPAIVELMIAESVRIKAEVVSADEREGDLRRILNFGHTYGHALEAATGYVQFLHGEAVAFGMRAATHLAELLGLLPPDAKAQILQAISLYGPIPSLERVSAEELVARLASDKKTVRGKVHFVLPEAIGKVRIVSGVSDDLLLAAARAALS